MIHTVKISGPVAQNKDSAREMRRTNILPALHEGKSLKIDFTNVTTATQSFIHALISEAVRLHGNNALGLLEFHKCSPQVAEAIETVVVYSLRARELSMQLIPDSVTIGSVDVPQADDLANVRRVVEVVTDGPFPVEDIVTETGFSIRHVHYRLNAARVLGLVRLIAGIALITNTGVRLVETTTGSEKERELLREAVASSTVLQRLAPRLLSSRPPDLIDITNRIMRLAKLSPSTAARRAGCLLSWRKQLLVTQLQLPIREEPVEKASGSKPRKKRSG
ncbi:STAS-like domain-containing protein [Sorangium sp. So ce233]|uniref:STAS-like domain-containing protein n=1 Tax=Sorangium sp. So ce233 TaxID=3133290 RepID=UPI003F5DA9A7